MNNTIYRSSFVSFNLITYIIPGTGNHKESGRCRACEVTKGTFYWFTSFRDWIKCSNTRSTRTFLGISSNFLSELRSSDWLFLLEDTSIVEPSAEGICRIKISLRVRAHKFTFEFLNKLTQICCYCCNYKLRISCTR